MSLDSMAYRESCSRRSEKERSACSERAFAILPSVSGKPVLSHDSAGSPLLLRLTNSFQTRSMTRCTGKGSRAAVEMRAGRLTSSAKHFASLSDSSSDRFEAASKGTFD